MIAETERLILRRWRDSDRDPFARMNADPRVMEFLPSALTREQSDDTVDRIEAHFREHGFGPFALELRTDQSFCGYVGLWIPAFKAHFTPCVEIGWRLRPDLWGQGLATEGARRVVQLARDQFGLRELVSFTVPVNLRSRRVMEKLGMTRDEAGDFDHPRMREEHPYRRHVLYRLTL